MLGLCLFPTFLPASTSTLWLVCVPGCCATVPVTVINCTLVIPTPWWACGYCLPMGLYQLVEVALAGQGHPPLQGALRISRDSSLGRHTAASSDLLSLLLPHIDHKSLQPPLSHPPPTSDPTVPLTYRLPGGLRLVHSMPKPRGSRWALGRHYVSSFMKVSFLITVTP